MSSRKKRKVDAEPYIARSSVRYEHGWALKTLAKKQTTSELHLHLGLMHMRCQQYSKALEDFHTALVSMGEGDGVQFAELNHMISYVELLLLAHGDSPGTPVNAISRRLRNAIERAPRFAPAWNTLGLLHLMHPSVDLQDEITPDAPESSVPLAANDDASVPSEDMDNAISFFTIVARNFPECEDVVNNLGVAHLLAGNLSTAARCFQTVLHKVPKHLEAMNNYGLVLHKQGYVQKALEMLEAALNVDDKPFYVWTNFAALLKHTRRHATATHALSRAYAEAEPRIMMSSRRNSLRRLSPAPSIMHVDEDASSFGKAKTWAASSYKRLRTDNSAVTGMSHAKHSLLGLNPATSPSKDAMKKSGYRTSGPKDIHALLAIGNNERMRHMRATNKSDSNRHLSRALRMLDKAQKSSSCSFMVHNQLGLLRMASGSWADATTAFEEAVTQLQSDEYSHALSVNLANSLILSGDLTRAEEVLTEAIDGKPDSHFAYCALGNLLLERGHFERALDAFTSCLDISPEYGDAHNNVGLVYLNLGDFNKAKEKFTEALLISPNLQSATTNMRRLEEYLSST